MVLGMRVLMLVTSVDHETDPHAKPRDESELLTKKPTLPSFLVNPWLLGRPRSPLLRLSLAAGELKAQLVCLFSLFACLFFESFGLLLTFACFLKSCFVVTILSWPFVH